MDEQRFGVDRHRPAGQWVQNTPLLEVAAVQNRKAAALAFARAAENAERRQWPYGLRFALEPTNQEDPNAIKVIGFAMAKPMFGATKEHVFDIGYIDRETAAEVHEDLVAVEHPFAAELSFIYRRGSFVAFAYHILVPKGSPATLRTHKRRAAAALDQTTMLTTAQKDLLAQRQLGLYRNSRLEQAQALKKLGHFDEALDMYLRVAWLDQQGPANVGLLDGEPMQGYPPLQKSYAFIAPGIIGAIAAAANTLDFSIDDLRARFRAGGDTEAKALSPMPTIVSHEQAWQSIEANLREATKEGGKWRAPKQKPT